MVLVDSHVALWALFGDARLGTECATALRQARRVYFSVVTPWELGIKEHLGKLDIDDDVADGLTTMGFEPLTIDLSHARVAAALPLHHRDPFDRMLIAQAQVEGLTLVSADKAFAAYAVETMDPRQ